MRLLPRLCAALSCLEKMDNHFAAMPMMRWGTPEGAAGAAVCYASEVAAFVTGQTLCVNGGNSPW